MRWLRGLWLIVLLGGCGEGGPPLDELPLRDALRADPEVVAALPDDARARLAARLEAARTGDGMTDPLAGAVVAAPDALVTVLDRTRERRQAEPLMEGVVADGLASPIFDRIGSDGTSTPALPAVEGEPATATASLEARALDGAAGASIRALLAVSRAGRLFRVVGWPVGAIAIGDVVYVDASWLVALAPIDGAGTDGGLDSGPDGQGPSGSATNGPGAPAPVPIAPVGDAGALSSSAAAESAAAEQVALPNPQQIAEAAGAQNGDAGTTPPPPQPSPSSGPGFWDACAAVASCDSGGDGSTDSCSGSTDDGSGDSCGGSTDDGSGDSCSGSTDDGSADACSAPPDDGGGCQVARGGRRAHFGTVLWLLAPLGFLLGKRP